MRCPCPCRLGPAKGHRRIYPLYLLQHLRERRLCLYSLIAVLMLPLFYAMLRGKRNGKMVQVTSLPIDFKYKEIEPLTKKTWRMVVLNYEYDKFVSDIVARTGQWDPHVSEPIDFILLIKGCREQTWQEKPKQVGNRNIVIDVGANIGFIAGLGAAHGCAVHAYEPQSILADSILKMSELNGWSCNVPEDAEFERGKLCVNNKAVSTNSYILRPKMHGKSGHGNLGAIGADFCGQIGEGNCEKVEAVGLDALFLSLDGKSLKNTDGRLLILKTDVEGYDADVMASAKGLIKARLIEHIFMELMPGNLPYSEKMGVKPNIEILEYLAECGYSIGELPLQPIERDRRKFSTKVRPVTNVTDLIRTTRAHQAVGLDGQKRQFTDIWASRDGSSIFHAFNRYAESEHKMLMASPIIAQSHWMRW